MRILSTIGKALRTVSGESAAGVALGITVLCMVLGSSSVPELVGPGKKLRWIALFVLAALSIALAIRERRSGAGRSLGLVLALGAWLAAMGVLSTAWSVDPRLTFGRSASFALLLLTAGALAFVAQARPGLPDRLLEGVLIAASISALVGLVMVVVAHGDAVQPATSLYPARLRGLGENPDTLAMLEGLAVPIGLRVLVDAHTKGRRVLALGALVLLLGSISASGSRGGLIAAFAGGIVLSVTLPAPLRRRLVLAAAVCVAMVGATAATRIPQPLPYTAITAQPGSGPSSHTRLPQPGQYVGPAEDRYSGRLTDELFRIYPGRRSLFTSSGRLQAWYTAIQQGDARPLLGYGFGTESDVFIDRVFNFNGSYTENSFVGFYLQLGALGALSALALVLSLCAGAVRGVQKTGAVPAAPVLAAVIAAGVVLMLVQSYAYSVGNVATVSFWVAGFLAAAVAAETERRSVDVLHELAGAT